MRAIVAAFTLLLSACSFRPLSHPCPGGNPRERQLGETIVRKRHSAAKALIFVQHPVAPVTMDLFWPERVASDDLFAEYDVMVLALRGLPDCNVSAHSASAVAKAIEEILREHTTAAIVTHDIRNVLLINAALSSLAPAQLQRVVEVLLFNTPAADRRVRDLPGSCLQAQTVAVPVKERNRVFCITFDRNRLRDVPLATSVCDQTVVAQMTSEIESAPLCEDALYRVFRSGLAGTIFEAEHGR
jgi:hypothetical protein